MPTTDETRAASVAATEATLAHVSATLDEIKGSLRELTAAQRQTHGEYMRIRSDLDHLAADRAADRAALAALDAVVQQHGHAIARSDATWKGIALLATALSTLAALGISLATWWTTRAPS